MIIYQTRYTLLALEGTIPVVVQIQKSSTYYISGSIIILLHYILCGFYMNEYKVIYWEDDSGALSFGTSVQSKFQNEINELAQDGWVVKCSNTTTIAQTNTDKSRISVYALLEREKIPAAFRERSKNRS